MSKSYRVPLISIICWTSSVLFGSSGVLMLAVSDRYEPPVGYALALGAIMMFGWVLLLLWADRNHEYRKGVFFISGLVAGGLLLAQVYGYFIGALSAATALVTGILLLGVITAFAFSYYVAKRVGCSKKYNVKQHFILKHLITRIL